MPNNGNGGRLVDCPTHNVNVPKSPMAKPAPVIQEIAQITIFGNHARYEMDVMIREPVCILVSSNSLFTDALPFTTHAMTAISPISSINVTTASDTVTDTTKTERTP